ncbi:hypothetical protein BDW22DRAFT_1210382 [Trametopsis cervina]|nr:hypothetical protein BDW22DRAFT_1210382 [Trametopsis cervina]
MDDDEQGSSLTNHRDFIESDDVQHSPADPLDDILQYILDNSECDAAIASDEDLHDINKHMELGRLPVSDFLQSSPPAVQISHNRVGSLKMPPTTLRDPPQETIPPLLSIENRSELLSQLRTRSEEIAKLMARLAEISARKEEDMQHEFPRPPHPSNNSTRGRSITSSTPPLTYRSPSVSDTVSDIASTRYSSEMDTKKRKLQPANIDVAQWIAGAQQSIEAFDAYIHMFPDDKGRAGSPMSYTPDYDFDSTSDDPAAAVYYSLSLSTGTTGPSSVQPTSSQNFASPPNPLPRGQVLRREKRHKIRKPSRPSAKGRDELHFRPKLVHPPIHENDIPHILRRGLISAAEIEQLFSIYWEYMNVSVNILDPVLYSAQQTYWRSPFLFTVICAIASRFHQARPDLYAKAMDYAQLAAGTALIGGKKSVDNVHAYLLLSLFPRPIQTRADDRSWLFVGVAIQMATDLGLHIPDKLSPKGDIHAREALNRTRAWLNCYNTDRVMSLQHCRAATINNDTYIVNHCDDFWRNSPSDMRGSDLLLSARTTLWSTASKFVEANLNGSDPASIIREVSVTEEMLTQLYTRWDEHLRAQATQLQEKRDIAQSIFMNTSLRLWYRFTRILVLSRSISGASLEFDSLPFMRYLQATLDVLTVFMEDDGESPFRLYMRHSPDLLFALLVSSCMHLLRLLSSRVEGEADMVGWVERIADVLGSPAFSVDEGHSATLLSHFLRAQLSIDAPYWTPPPAEDGSSRRMEDDPSVPVPDVFATPLYLDPNVLLAKRLIPMQRLVPDSSLLVKGEIVDRKPTF